MQNKRCRRPQPIKTSERIWILRCPLSRLSWREALFAILALVMLVTLVVRARAATQTLRESPSGPLVGHMAPDFTLAPWNGAQHETVTLVALRGTPIVINFWEATCDPCRAEAPLLASAWQTYHVRGITFLGVALATTQEDGMRFIDQYHVLYPTGPGDVTRLGTLYALSGTPVTVFVDRHGVVAQRIVGQISAPALDAAVRALLT